MQLMVNSIYHGYYAFNLNILYQRIVKILQHYRPRVQWLADHKECKVMINDGNSGNNLIYFPCLKFIKERLDLFEEYGIGAFVWEGGNGMKYFYELF